jgi:hypothetical protein
MMLTSVSFLRQCTINPFATVAYFLYRFLHRRAGFAGLLSFVSGFVILSACDARPILSAPASCPLFIRHATFSLWDANA